MISPSPYRGTGQQHESGWLQPDVQRLCGLSGRGECNPPARLPRLFLVVSTPAVRRSVPAYVLAVREGVCVQCFRSKLEPRWVPAAVLTSGCFGKPSDQNHDWFQRAFNSGNVRSWQPLEFMSFSTPWGLSRPHWGRGVSIFLEFTMSQVSPEARREFHAVFADWLSHASDEETDQLVALQVKYPPEQVQSLLTFIRLCLADPTRCAELPSNLRTRLQARNWPQGGCVLQVA